MKKLVILIGLVALFAACQEESDSVEPNFSQSKIGTAELTSLKQPDLLDDKRFASAYQESVKTLQAAKEEIVSSINIRSLEHQDGMIVVNSEKQFRPVYESVAYSDSVWQQQHGDEIDALIEVAFQNPEIADQFDKEEVSFMIEDLLEKDEIDYLDVQQGISDQLPIATLWQKIKSENDEWLANAGEKPNWEENPAEQYGIETYAQLFINQESQINILDTVRNIKGEVSFESGEEAERGLAGCRTFRMCTEFTDNTGHPTCLRARVYINNFWLWRSFGSNAKGWRWINGRWRERRFQKTLTRGGFVIMHRAQLANPCDPAFAQWVGWTSVRNNVEFQINATVWNTYAGACTNSFSGAVSGGGRAQGVVMD